MKIKDMPLVNAKGENLCIIIKKEIHIPVSTLRERTYKILKTSRDVSIRWNRIFCRVYCVYPSLYRWTEDDVEREVWTSSPSAYYKREYKED